MYCIYTDNADYFVAVLGALTLSELNIPYTML